MMARVIELRVKKENMNFKRVFIKCPRNVERGKYLLFVLWNLMPFQQVHV